LFFWQEAYQQFPKRKPEDNSDDSVETITSI